jgi:hypothetical protein
MPPERPKYSRYGRLPGVHWITEKRIPGPEADLERLTLYLPGGVIDQAMVLTRRARAQSLQAFCEELLQAAIEGPRAVEETWEDAGSTIPSSHGFDAIAGDVEYLVEWSASVQPPPCPDTPALPSPQSVAGSAGRSAAESVVLRHADTEAGGDGAGLLATLRRGETISPDSARELLQALVDLEAQFRDAAQLDRALSYALHRLAFEGQVLLTDAFPGLASDRITLETLRTVQEGADRVLSGRDIRYYPEGPASGAGSPAGQ